MCAGHGEARILWNSTNTRLTIAAVTATAAPPSFCTAFSNPPPHDCEMDLQQLLLAFSRQFNKHELIKRQREFLIRWNFNTKPACLIPAKPISKSFSAWI